MEDQEQQTPAESHEKQPVKAKKSPLVSIITTVLVIAAAAGIAFFLMGGTDDNDKTVENAATTSQTETKQSTSTDAQQKDGSSTASDVAGALTKAQVALHDKKDDCWTIVNGVVYNITEYVPKHPGGESILDACGTDGTSLFTERKTSEGEKVGSGTPHSSNAQKQLEKYKIGELDG